MGQHRTTAPTLGVYWLIALALLFCAAPAAAQPTLEESSAAADLPEPDSAIDDLLDMDLERLSHADVFVPAMDTVVSTVSRQESTIGRSPAAVFVITQEMIRHSAARNIPDLLRMVPGVEVARIDANKWAISIRGFNSRFANTLLVQIDSRVVYNQTFNGVYWDAQDLVLEDIERIEVIRGPGATVWGANAVNGIINIITKNAKDTQGYLVVGGTGTEERGFSTVRYGGSNGSDMYWRVYGKQFERDGGYYLGEDFDDWRQVRGGFRLDWTPSPCDAFMLQGDFYDGESGSFDVLATPPTFVNSLNDSTISGQDYLSTWTHTIDDDTEWRLLTYFDRTVRHHVAYNQDQQTFNLDYQYRFRPAWRHNVICGCGYRHIRDEFIGSITYTMDPPIRNSDLYSCFIEDEITLIEDRLYLTAGSKFEHNSFSGFEVQPSIRMLYLPSERESAWAAVSRAVQTPGRTDHDFLTYLLADPAGPTFVELTSDPATVSRELLAFELGYRAQPTDEFSWDLALFYNNYQNLSSAVSTGAPFFDPGLGAVIVPQLITNTHSADTYGAEITSTYWVNPNWELTGAYSLLYLDIHALPGDLNEGSSPHNRLYVRSSWKPRCDLELDLIGRYVDNVPALGISSYLTMDVRIAWRPYKDLEWAVVGRNLFDDRHKEFSDELAGTIGTDVQSEVFTTLTWTY